MCSVSCLFVQLENYFWILYLLLVRDLLLGICTPTVELPSKFKGALSSPQYLPVNLLLLHGTTAFDNLALPRIRIFSVSRLKSDFIKLSKPYILASSPKVLKHSQRMNPLKLRNHWEERNASKSDGICSFPWFISLCFIGTKCSFWWVQ